MLLLFYILHQILRGCIILVFYAFVGAFWLSWFLILALYHLTRAIYHASIKH